MDDGVGGGEIEAAAAGFEADQEERRLTSLETLDEIGSVLGAAGKFQVVDLRPLQLA